MNAKLGFFPYEAMDYKAAQSWLDRQGTRGWALKHVYLGCIALLRRAEHPTHFVDLDIRGIDEDTDADYLQLCADADWELVQNLRGMLLFRAAAGTSPAPIQTDGELEWERFWEKYRPRFWTTLLILFCVGLIAFLLTLPTQRNIPAMLAASLGLLYLLYFAFAVLYTLAKWLHSKWYLAKCRRANRVEDPGPMATVLGSLNRLQTLLLCLILFFTFAQPLGFGRTVDLDWYSPNETYTATVEACQAWPVVTAADLGLGDSGYSRHLEGFRSILADFLEYRELTRPEGPDGSVYILTTERYDCLNGWLARWVLNQRQAETQNGAFLWGELDWEPTPGLGFDESYTCQNNAYLLFRQGKVVALVGCTGLDLTQPQSLDAIRARILR